MCGRSYRLRPPRQASIIESMPSMAAVRYGLPSVIGVAGIAIALPGTDTALEGGSMFVGAGLSVLVLNLLFRFGTSGDIERDAEEAARRYFDEHGHWPDEWPATSRRPSPNPIADGAPAGGDRCAGPIIGDARVTACAGRGGQRPPRGSARAGPRRCILPSLRLRARRPGH
jgi:hypothetical protein